jgi:hypothetical protein
MGKIILHMVVVGDKRINSHRKLKVGVWSILNARIHIPPPVLLLVVITVVEGQHKNLPKESKFFSGLR